MNTHGDSWDITTSVGSTALFVAAARALEAQERDPLAVDRYAEVFCRAVGGDWADLLDGRKPDHVLETEFGRHFRAFQGARTRYFDNYFREAVDAGVRQIVILAAGLDSRGYRLPWPDGTVIYELDQPKVLEFKREVLTSRGDTPTAQRREVAVDLREDWPAALRDNGFDPAQPSAWLAEGLLLYLPATVQERLFLGIDALSSPGSRLAVEETMPMPPEAFKAAVEEERAVIAERGPFFTLLSNEQIARPEQWFSARGWRAATTHMSDYLRGLGRPVPPPDAEGGPMMMSTGLVSAVKG